MGYEEAIIFLDGLREIKMNYQDELIRKTKQIEDIIFSYLPKEEGFQKTLISSMNYSMMGKGKRIRPLLIQETYRLFGGTGKVYEPFAAAMEMIHTYSLVHDDLPAMDNDDYRRGRKTTHVVYGTAMGIFAGDGLLTYAFEVAVKAFDLEPNNSGIAKALEVLAKNSGLYGMLGGQSVDVELTGQPLDEATLDFIYRLKTGALIEGSMLIGAYLAGASEEEISIIKEIAYGIGMSFQIQDDILDIIGDASVIGKPVLSDEKNNKTTYVTIHGLDESKKKVKELSLQSIKLLNSLPYRNEFLNEFVKALINRDK